MLGERFKLLAVSIGVVTSIALAGCGASPEERAAAERAEKAARKAEKRAELLAVEAVNCQRQLGGFIDALKTLGSKLDVGLNFVNYSEEVAALNVEYDDVPIGQMSGRCINQAGIPSENSLNSYLDAYNTWNECFAALTCDSVEPELQASWANAESLLEKARSGLRSLRGQAVSADDAATAAKKKANELSEGL